MKKQKQLNARSKAFALASELLFFACAKESNQKKAHPAFAPRPLARSGFAAPAGFFAATSCRGEKRRTSLCAVLRILPAISAAAEGNPKSGKAKATTTATATATAIYSNQ